MTGIEYSGKGERKGEETRREEKNKEERRREKHAWQCSETGKDVSVALVQQGYGRRIIQGGRQDYF